MELEIIEKGADKLSVYVDGANHTILNVVVAMLQKDNRVLAAAYTIDHPLNARPKLFVQTKKGDPKAILTEAIDSLQKDYANFLKAFEKAFA